MSSEQKSEIDIIQEFNEVYLSITRTLQKLCNAKKYKGFKKLNKARIALTFEFYIKLIKGDPQFALTEFGPYIFLHRERILINNANYFINKNYGIFMMAMCNKYDIDYQYSMELIDLCKEVYVVSSDDIKDEMHERMQKLMILYSQFGMIT
jgi:hypothetical protein